MRGDAGLWWDFEYNDFMSGKRGMIAKQTTSQTLGTARQQGEDPGGFITT